MFHDEKLKINSHGWDSANSLQNYHHWESVCVWTYILKYTFITWSILYHKQDLLSSFVVQLSHTNNSDTRYSSFHEQGRVAKNVTQAIGVNRCRHWGPHLIPWAPLFAAIIVIFTAGHLPHPPLFLYLGSKPVLAGYPGRAPGRQRSSKEGATRVEGATSRSRLLRISIKLPPKPRRAPVLEHQ